LILSGLYGYYTFMKYAKFWELSKPWTNHVYLVHLVHLVYLVSTEV